jgi:hypothetical protein
MLRSTKTALCLALWLSLPSPDAKADLIINGNFEQGNTGFTTQYTLSRGDIGPAGSYDVVDNPAHSRPHDAHPVSYGDHTTGQGLMMAINGAENASLYFWSETVSVRPHTDYAFSMWISSWFGPPVDIIDVRFNEVSLGTPSAPSTVAVWQEFSKTWNSGDATTLTIKMFDLDLADVGSDFAVDDISLIGPSAVPVPPSLMLALTGGVSLLGWRWLGKNRVEASASVA